jgi:hypothetical protein
MPGTLLDELLKTENSNTVRIYSNLNTKVEFLTKEIDVLAHSIEKYSISDVLKRTPSSTTNVALPFNTSVGVVAGGASNLEKMVQALAEKANAVTTKQNQTYEDSPNIKEDPRKETEHFIGEKNPLQDDEDAIAKYSKLIYELLKDWKGLFKDGKPTNKLATGEGVGVGGDSNIPWWALGDLKPQGKVKEAEEAKVKEAEEAKTKAEEEAKKAKTEAEKAKVDSEKAKAEAEKTKVEAEKINSKVKEDIEAVKSKAADEAEKAAKQIAEIENRTATAVKNLEGEVKSIRVSTDELVKSTQNLVKSIERSIDEKIQKMRDEAAAQARKERDEARSARDKAEAEAEAKAKASAEAEAKAKTAAEAEAKAKTALYTAKVASEPAAKESPSVFKSLLKGAGKTLSTVFSDWSPFGIFGGEIANPTSLGPRQGTPDYDIETGNVGYSEGTKAQDEFLNTVAPKYSAKSGEELKSALFSGKIKLDPDDQQKYVTAYTNAKDKANEKIKAETQEYKEKAMKEFPPGTGPVRYDEKGNNKSIELAPEKFQYNITPETEKSKDLGPLNDDQHLKDIHKSTSDIHTTMTTGFNTVSQAIYELAKTLHFNSTPNAPSQNVVVNAPASITPNQTPDASDVANNYVSSITSTRKSYLDAYDLAS